MASCPGLGAGLIENRLEYALRAGHPRHCLVRQQRVEAPEFRAEGIERLRGRSKAHQLAVQLGQGLCAELGQRGRCWQSAK